MQRIALVLAILGMSLAPAGLAHAQLGGPNVPSPLTEPTPPPPVDSDVDEGLSSLQQILIFVGAALVLGVISFVIVRDARRAAPTSDDRPHKGSPAAPGPKAAAAGGGAADPSASAARARERQRAKREKAKAKAARQQRKRNRRH